MTARLILEHVSKTFDDGNRRVPAVEDVDLQIAEGEFISIVGPSGCGKTTLLNMVGGFVIPTTGRVLLDGAPIAGPGSDRGFVFQDYGVFPWLSVRDNIVFGLKLHANFVPPRERDAIADRYLDVMGLRDFRDAFPKALSGGMKQRVALARSYAVRPQFLLMDEPFGALDAQTRYAMQDLLLDLQAREGKTILFVTHSVEEALYLSSRVIAVTARPTRIRRVLEVPFAYPRNDLLRHAPEFQNLVAELESVVMSEYAAQQRQTTIANEGTT
ncbi:MAG TPA: ABC transporter ATP-binding protein [Candidatus Acidoferrales bacterium]|nr:ABC transporter ATP-binding protein [Candidatus Acidoferrales bacterium]